MELIPTSEDEDVDRSATEALQVHAWRAEQLGRLGLPRPVADAFADRVDWHVVAGLIERGCSLALALEIVR